MTEILEVYDVEKTCEYRGDIYYVRDNGAVYRCKRPGKRKRPLDEKWTFGTPNKRGGYLNFSSEAVHRIVATAFHGHQPSEKHIVDHVDTNKKNNRPENLRWVTRLENILLNPITLSRIIYKYGSIDRFLSNPSKPLNGVLEQNYDWMRTVTKEEAENTRKNLLRWASSGNISKGGTLGEWIHSNLKEGKDSHQIPDPLSPSLTSNAIQKDWITQSEFPSCPPSILNEPLTSYKEKLIEGTIFSKNKYGDAIVVNSEINETTKELFVLAHKANTKPYSLAKVYIDGDVFIHENLGSFFTLSGAQKQFNLALGIAWDGKDSIDDYS